MEVSVHSISPSGGTFRSTVKLVAAWMLGVATLVGGLFTYMTFAHDAGWFPYTQEVDVQLKGVEDGYQVGDQDFSIHVRGNLAEPYNRVWIVAMDEAEYWYPLAEAYRDGDEWSARIHSSQFGKGADAELSLHGVVTDDQASNDLSAVLHRTGSAKQGMISLPVGARSVDHVAGRVHTGP